MARARPPAQIPGLYRRGGAWPQPGCSRRSAHSRLSEHRPVEVVAGIRQEHRRHRGGRHRRRMRQGRAARLQGPPDLLVHRSVRRRARNHQADGQGVLGGLEGDLPEHRDRRAEHQLQRPARQVSHGLARQRRPDGCETANPGRRGICRQGLSAGAEARGRRILDVGLLARRDEVGDLGRQDLRHPDQQRDHGASSGMPRSSRMPASIRKSRRRPGTTSSPIPRPSTTSSASPATAWSPSRTPATRRSASCPSSGPMAAAALDEAARAPSYGTVELNSAGEQGGAAGVLRHVCARQVGAGFGAHQHAGRKPEPLHRRPARHDDRPPGRVRQDARSRGQGDGRRQGGRRRGRREHALRPDPRGPGAPRRGVRRLQHPRPQAGIRGRRDRRDGGEGAHLHVDQPRMVDASSPGSARTRAICAASRPSG